MIILNSSASKSNVRLALLPCDFISWLTDYSLCIYSLIGWVSLTYFCMFFNVFFHNMHQCVVSRFQAVYAKQGRGGGHGPWLVQGPDRDQSLARAPQKPLRGLGGTNTIRVGRLSDTIRNIQHLRCSMY